LHPNNVDSVLALVKRVKDECPGKNIWLWSGYKMTELDFAQSEVIDLVDVFIDGKYEEKLYRPNLAWRGSTNQIIHTIKG
jgi:anaerobic ribonucleoside-triphosphate reductase activating protein